MSAHKAVAGRKQFPSEIRDEARKEVLERFEATMRAKDPATAWDEIQRESVEALLTCAMVTGQVFRSPSLGGLSPVQFKVLLLLRQGHSGDLLSAEKMLGVSRSSTCRALRRLEDWGLVTSRPHGADRRKKVRTITAHGIHAADAIAWCLFTERVVIREELRHIARNRAASPWPPEAGIDGDALTQLKRLTSRVRAPEPPRSAAPSDQLHFPVQTPTRS